MTNETTKPVVTQAALLPCPFCGGEATLAEDPYWVGNVERQGFCGWCKACDLSLDYLNDRGSAITAWNTRAHSSQAVVSQDLVPVANPSTLDAQLTALLKCFDMRVSSLKSNHPMLWDDATRLLAKIIEAAQIAARNDALDEAAKVADDLDTFDRDVRISAAKAVVAIDISAAISALRTPSQHQEEQ